MRHRDNREWVRELENQITEAAHTFADRDWTKRDKINLAQINRDLVDCHKVVLWKRPEGYIDVVNALEKTRLEFKGIIPSDRIAPLEETDHVMEQRLSMLKSKLQGIQTHRQVTISRLNLIGAVLQNLVSLSIFKQEQQMRIAKLERQETEKFERSREKERRDIQKAEKELETTLEVKKQTAMALLGVMFLPGAFVAVSLPSIS